MLSQMPSEIVVHVAIYLTTISDLTNLAQTCHRLHKIFNAEESAIFRSFVQEQFPSIPVPPFWKDAARALTARSRALDRLGIIGRFVIPPATTIRIGLNQPRRLDNPTLGYRPSIDSYEIWNGERWADRREVLAWGAGHQLVMRTKQSGSRPKEQWVSFNDLEEASSYDDICGVHLIQPESDKDTDVEHLIIGRMRGDIVHVALSVDTATHEYKRKFMTSGNLLERTDVADHTMAAHFDNGSVALYQLENENTKVEPFAWVGLEGDQSRRGRYSKLLSSSRIAMATGQIKDSLSISTVSPNGVCLDREIGLKSLDIEDQVGRSVNAVITAIASLNKHPIAGSPGDVFLATWGDRKIRYVGNEQNEDPDQATDFFTPRLHDLRSPNSYETTYLDSTDANIIYSVQPFGHDRFLAGAAGNAILKIFDLRMSKTYSYLNTHVPTQAKTSSKPTKKNIAHYPHKDFSMFLSSQIPSVAPRNPRANKRRPYSGPIYTMSTPSPSSPTVYAGIVDGVVRLDFASTDDLTGPGRDWYDHNLDIGVEIGHPSVPIETEGVLKLAGYERPDSDDFTTTSKLRSQHGFWYPDQKHINHGAGDGWDRRWEPLEKAGAWRRKDGGR
ncbi:hypothetical protein N7520_011746 [Penicillium odoratum]|uniref:uncharacterized protein n=1 Tax=Penicillium odoratum TaxID=1167516 RepID=UPI0025482286|nr:uncharacterized protein N7520_011746 [Penicillium odoratum]KAJ5746564.1 hypothetical protein N7520_011746 [Penicillium odoratum]